jgi:chromosome segregation ATPase
MPPRRLETRRGAPKLPDSSASLKKIKEEINAAARQLGELTTERDTLKAENKKLHDEKTTLHNDISQARLALDDVRSQVDRTSQAHVTLDAEHATKRAAYANTVSDLEAQIATLKKELADLEPLRKEITELKSIKATLSQELDVLEKNISFIREERRVEDEAMEAKRQDVRKEINVLNELIEKNGRMVQGHEHDRALLEIYVRRLQRYYDETGISLSILPAFGLLPYGEKQ